MQLEKLGPDKQGNQWIRAFLLNFKPNDQGWFVSKDTANKNILSAVDKPLILHKQEDKKLDHLGWNNLLSVEANIAEQTKKAIGVIKRVLWSDKDESYYADVKITDPAANEFISQYEKNNLSIPTSPQLIYDGRKQKPTDLKDWFVSHLAVVTKGAFGPDAKVIDSCSSVDEKPCFAEPIQGSSKFDFCVKSALNSAVVGSSLQNSDAHQNISIMSMTEVKPTEDQQQQQPNLTNKTIDTPAINTAPQREAPYLKDLDNKTKAPIEVQNTEVISDYKKAYEDIKSKYESEIPTLKSQLDEHAKTLEQIKVEKRRIEVASVIPPHISEFKDKNGNFSSQKYNETIESLAAKSYDVADLAKFYGKIAELEDQVPKTAAPSNNAKAAYGSSVEAASSTSQDNAAIIRTPKLESVESASTANFGSSLVKSVPINGKRKGRIA